MIQQAREELEKGNSVMIFPEGTRTDDGRFQRFREGGFRIVLDAKTGILPMVLDGTLESIPKKGFIMNKRVHITLRVMDEIPYPDFGTDNPAELMEKVKTIMEKEYGEMTHKKYLIDNNHTE
jgi:1-acyl-sn-glycerol-3-phosphate acyltransferase